MLTPKNTDLLKSIELNVSGINVRIKSLWVSPTVNPYKIRYCPRDFPT